MVEEGLSIELLDASGAAERLRCGRVAVDQLIRAGELPASRLGQSWIIRGTDIEDWAQANPTRLRRRSRVPASARADLKVLAAIAEGPGMTVVGLAALRGESRRTVLERLQRLERENLITREPGPLREPHQCYATEAGRERYHSQTASSIQADSA